MIYSKCAPRPGSHIELRRGGELVIARVVWRKNHRIGLSSRDPLPVETIISCNTAEAASPSGYAGLVAVERRALPRDPDRSVARARAFEFLSLVLIGTVLAIAAAAQVREALAKPGSAVQRALDSQ
jgi:hypothetical protein